MMFIMNHHFATKFAYLSTIKSRYYKLLLWIVYFDLVSNLKNLNNTQTALNKFTKSQCLSPILQQIKGHADNIDNPCWLPGTLKVLNRRLCIAMQTRRKSAGERGYFKGVGAKEIIVLLALSAKSKKDRERDHKYSRYIEHTQLKVFRLIGSSRGRNVKTDLLWVVLECCCCSRHVLFTFW
jgi:hypothetical protein